jgi:dUTP pyrophosphatase
VILQKSELLRRIKEQKLFTDYVDLEQQLQPASFDLTLQKVFAFKDGGTIDFDNAERKLSEVEELPFDASDKVFLKPGAYKVRYNEIVSLPSDLCAFNSSRSSLTRCGAAVQIGFWDPGYSGRSENMLAVMNPAGLTLKKNAKITQLMFVTLDDHAAELYKGIHHKENV